jgi:hypothetical protein
MTNTATVYEHEPYLMSMGSTAPGRLNLGTWIECECGWISNNSTRPGSVEKSHEFHVWLAETYPRGEGLEITRLRAKAWCLTDVNTGEQVSPKNMTWDDKATAQRALRILRAGGRA